MQDEPGHRDASRPRATGAGDHGGRQVDREVDAGLELEEGERLVLGDLINRVLDKGVVISGQVTVSVADIDLIALDLRVLITSIQTAIDRVGFADPSSHPLGNADVPVLPPDASRGS